MNITLEPITFENVQALLALKMGDISPKLVQPPCETIAFAYVGTLQGLAGFCKAICADGKPVGLFLIGEAIADDEDPEAARACGRFFRMTGFMLDAAYRGQGIGRKALAAVLKGFDAEYGNCPLVLDCYEGNPAAHHLYAQAGFVDTGLWRGRDMVMMRMPQNKRATGGIVHR